MPPPCHQVAAIPLEKAGSRRVSMSASPASANASGARAATTHGLRARLRRMGALCVLLLLAFQLPAFAQTPPAGGDPVQVARERVEATRSALNSLEGTLSVEGLRSSDLDDLRDRLDPVRKEIQQQVDALGPRLASSKARLQELGTAPAEGAPAEDPATTAARAQLTQQVAALDAALKQYVALTTRATQITDQISTRRRVLFANQVLERSNSVLDPALWMNAGSAITVETRALRFLGRDWLGYARQRYEPWALTAIAFGSAVVFAVVLRLGVLLRRRFACPPPEDGAPLARLRAAREAFKVFIFHAVTWPAALLATGVFLGAFELIPERVAELLRGIAVATFIYALGHALARALIAPAEPWRRLIGVSDRAAVISFRYYHWTVLTLSIAAFLSIMHRALFAPLALTVATSAIMSLLIGAFVARSLIVLARAAEDDDPSEQPGGFMRLLQPLRLVMWVALTAILIALASGYISLAAFVASRIVLATTVAGAVYLLTTLIDSFFEGLTPNTPQAKLFSKILGLKPNRLELIGILVAALLKLSLMFTGLFLVVGSWSSTSDVIDTVERATFGVRIGSMTVTLWSVLYAVLLLLVGIFVARTFQGWMANRVLPRTDLEPSLQTSISTVVGYLGIIVAIAVAMSEVGLNLENVALVAGALSVGIGFGLQSIVSNFVSGLILLAERPIRVGDTINVKGEEGYVRRISVRSTEIETFERSTVIVPNSDLITGMVKNFTHSNTTGRVIVAMNVTYDADTDLVRDLLVGAACDHPQVIQSPPPRVFLTKLLDAGMVFELRCVVANVDYALTVKSDLHFSILSRFRKAGVGIACQPWAALARAPSDMVPAPSAPPPPPPAEPEPDLPPASDDKKGNVRA
ncbi:MAG: mechanosensitive ion channel protein MscS [Rhizobiales bacterium 12-68-15]|nr:MAG: mechanosensitive ion channel protein MscS [Rhizobiales bacterium 12-68-15]